MAFDISALIDSTKKTFQVAYNDDITVTLKLVSREELGSMLKRATVTSFNRSTHQKEQDFDHLLYGELLGRAAIADWSGIEVAGQPYPCTPDNAALLMRRWSDFARFVADTSSDLERLDAEEKELLRKNSSSTSEPEQTTLQ